MVPIASDPPAPPDPVAARLSVVAGSLRDRLLPLVTEVAGTSPRPARLVQRLGLDKSLASRLLRSLRADSDMELLHRFPSPTGLRILLDRAAQAGVDPQLIRDADEAVDQFQSLLDDTPGGRASLDAHMSDSVLEVRLRRERSSKQAIFKGMSFLLGYYCDALATTLIMQPAENGRRVDGIEVHHRVGMRRIRPNTPLAVLSLRVPSEEGPPEDAIRIETLAGRPGTEDPRRLLLPEFCTSPMPELAVHREQDHTMISLENDDPSLDSSVSLTTAFCIRNGWLPHRTEEIPTASRGYLLHVPCKLLVRDLFIRDDAYFGAVPEITLELPDPAGAQEARPTGAAARTSTLDLSAPIEQLRPGLAGIAMSPISTYHGAVLHAFDRLGWDPARFRGYRCAIQYPVPMITMSWWLALQNAPD